MRPRRSIASSLKDLHSADPAIREAARKHLVKRGGPEVTAGLIQALREPDAVIRSHVVRALGALAAGYEDIVRLLEHDPSEAVRLVAAVTLSTQFPVPTRAFCGALSESNERIVTIACITLGHSGDPAVVGHLRAQLQHSSWKVRLRASEALVRLKAVDAGLLATLEELAKDREAVGFDAGVVRSRTVDAALGTAHGILEELTTSELISSARRVLRERPS